MDFIVSPAILVLVPIIVGLVALAKLYISSRFAPLIALALGIIGAFLINGTSGVGVTVISGIVIGLSASGLYSGTKATLTTDSTPIGS